MSSIIIFIIIAILGSLFSGDKKKPNKKPTKQMPSFGQQTNPENSKPAPKPNRPAVKSLEDFANEIFGQLNEQAEQPKPRKPVSQSVPVQQPVTETARPAFAGNDNRRSERPALAERPLTVKLKKEEQSFVPKTKQQLVQGIVMAEVLGKPKALRK
jgi:hypothetical protein